jgi:hypothetical protein
MLTLDLPVEPYWLDLPRGLRVEIRPVTTAVMATAQAAVSCRLGAIRAAGEASTLTWCVGHAWSRMPRWPMPFRRHIP